MKFHFEKLPDVQTNKNYIKRRIVMAAKDKKSLLKISDIRKMYEKMEADGDLDTYNTSILYQDITGHTIHLKTMGEDIKDYDDDYYNDRVQDEKKFTQGVRAIFMITLKNN